MNTTEISINDIPATVVKILNDYVNLLQSSANEEEAADKLAPIAAGSLLTNDGQAITNSVKQFGLKKDFDNAKFYKSPAVITRAQCTTDSHDGFEETLVTGTSYKIWIEKKAGINGMPAPVKIIVSAQYDSPRVIANIGSF